ncbi:hypothetical protein MLD38_036281 [Melastoma candidum]|uniref:Uncharacterized protein n=2 Tax=Melastoma candidum TaxID=119954 RepID=A0ACB9LJM7_9MYRT|nr:hypothetical protein MLD38_036280 [Melastoma candidum]KAI4311378.1 hypothetical protein MLD38_036281 [Melastoma candidum]
MTEYEILKKICEADPNISVHCHEDGTRTDSAVRAADCVADLGGWRPTHRGNSVRCHNLYRNGSSVNGYHDNAENENDPRRFWRPTKRVVTSDNATSSSRLDSQNSELAILGSSGDSSISISSIESHGPIWQSSSLAVNLKDTAPITRPQRLGDRGCVDHASRARSSSFLSGENALHFPLDMELEVRLDVLEALEYVLGDTSDPETSIDFLGTQRDFTEDDYEILLALDENNVRTGASVHQICSLPEFKAQNDSFGEACTICLEVPAKGDMIRRLPCLHKFHKDCIDPWLSRSRSCPICKSPIS